MSKTTAKLTKFTIVLALSAAGWWGVRWFLERDKGGENGIAWLVPFKDMRIERAGPGGVRYSVDANRAVYRLEMLPEDGHSQHVFTSYGAALRYARERNLPGLPSASLVLATCSASDFRMQAALEMALDADPQTGRAALLRRWLNAVMALRTQAQPGALAACDGAAIYLATAMLLGKDEPSLPEDLRRLAANATSAANDPPLGPWATTPELATIWRRDRFLACGIEVREAAGAAVAAVLARTQVADGQLAAGWQKQLAVSRVLHGKEPAVTFESLAAQLTNVPDAEITGPVAVECVQSAVAQSGSGGECCNPAPAALSRVMTPEEEVLMPLQMKAWNDPVGSLVRSIRAGEISLAPGPDAGFYRHRWYALETLAAPARAPEALKLQLSADYQRRWQRAFAAGFTEGRSGFIKRLPIVTMGSKMEGEVPVDVAPQFTAEPAPVVYLRLARAYRALERALAVAMGDTPWLQLRDASGAPVASDLRQRADVLYGLALKVYREVGFAPQLLEDEAIMDVAAAKAAADAWCATLETNPDVNRDARLLVPLATDGTGSQRCPAVLGVRLEPVQYSWVEEPDVSAEMKARFVPARYWLASPIPAILTVSDVPSPAEFRKRCDGHANVRGLYAVFRQNPPPLHTPARRWWPWLAAGVVLLGSAFGVARWWRQRTQRCRRFVLAGMGVGFSSAIVFASLVPPLWLLRLTFLHVLMPCANLVGGMEDGFFKWAGKRQVTLAMDFLQDPDAQTRYYGAMMTLYKLNDEACTATQWALLRSRIHDDVPEVGWAAWAMLCRRENEIAFLIDDLDHCDLPEDLRLRLRWLGEAHPSHPDVVGVALQLAADPRPAIRAAVLPCLAQWKPSVPAMVDAVRAATRDADAAVREQAVIWLGIQLVAADLNPLLILWRDPAARVRSAAFKAVGKRIRKSSAYPKPADPTPRWTDQSIQPMLVEYARNPAVTFEERLAAARWIADPATLRASCKELLAEAERLPDLVVHDGTQRWTRHEALALLAMRWVLAEQYAQFTSKNSQEYTCQLEAQPTLLDALTACMAANRDAAGTLEVLRMAARQPETLKTAGTLMQRLQEAAQTPGQR
jgi:hypothetical protein